MANGDLIQHTGDMHHWIMLDDIGAGDDGVWIDAGGRYDNLSVHVTGITTATVVINGSNAATKPANTVHGIALASVTADAMIQLTLIPIWIKGRISAWTSGDISAFGLLRRSA